jgi:hypothetical protein
MPELSDTVGDGGKNNKHDVAIVEVMLRLIKNAKGSSYFPGEYDGQFTAKTKQAIRDYQTEKGLAAVATPAQGKAAGVTGGPGGIGTAAAGTEKLGLITAGGQTFTQLVKDLPANYANIRCFPQTNVVYLEHDANDLAVALASTGKSAVETSFRAQVVSLTNNFYTKHKLALSIARHGGLRDFKTQDILYKRGRSGVKGELIVTNAGPGESNHHWGRAVDISPNKVKWLRGNTSLVTDDWWFNDLAKESKAKFYNFFDALIAARDAIAVPSGMFRLKKKNKAGKMVEFDPMHLQSFDDSKSSAGRSLVALLNAVGVGVCEWKYTGGSYSSDYGIGGTTLFHVGTAVDVYREQAVVTKNKIAQAYNEAAKAKSAGKPFKKLTAADIKGSEIAEIRKRMKADWVKAEAAWPRWNPTP